jgi:alginate O-acetyltransferase complex protein AlgI
MVFSSPLFLFFFLPIVLGAHFICPRPLRNLLLLAASLWFYAWGEPALVLVLLASIGMNYGLGLWVHRAREQWLGPYVLAVAVIANIGLLGYYKYGHFIVDNLNWLLTFTGFPALDWSPQKLPIGISFYTFQALSYVIDVYRAQTRPQRNPLHLALYITLFPQLIAGPIVRYVDIAEQLNRRRITLAGFASGIERFVLGLGKKVLLANAAASVADQVFDIPNAQLTSPVAWLGIFCYTCQIYFDFSGYSDMAIGLGRMFGFEFMENFRYPYVARSVTDFWRRWHISLSTWFRDYLYIPLGGNRCPPWRTYTNLLIVFLLCGLWHGASWNFVAWGFFHGLFLVLERVALGKLLDRVPRPLRHAYVLCTVMVGWALFRCVDLVHAGVFLQAMFGLTATASSPHHVGLYLDSGLVLVLAVGILGAMPVLPWLQLELSRLSEQPSDGAYARFLHLGVSGVKLVGLSAVLICSAVVVSASTYNPFIYFRF